MTGALLTFLALDCGACSAAIAQRAHAIGCDRSDAGCLAFICGVLLAAGGGFLVLAGAA